ncbi:SDR family NAD(P)-dependent oxidoreductase [Marinospirillum perlucidum]|uniref:SDR family NAD(P)-dependent oxidoreductase n=1 Tax=Marinospirillum perlucidum TaxID=1982602 RepID=UPI000DF1D2E8|nr:SDR family NAD(P)-dependent oxidoreductase [Marinospirillum perlucidum]
MKPLQQPSRIWITGAGSGIGRELALQLAEAGHRLVISGRRYEPLQEVADEYPHVEVAVADVTSPVNLQQAVSLIEEKLGGVDMVILNAGTCEYLDDGKVDAARIRRVLETNFMGLVYSVEAVQALLSRSPSPALVALSSSAAYAPLPRAEAYGASKAAVSYFMESLRADLAAQKVFVSVVYPGFVKTPLTDRNDFPMPMRISAEEAARQIILGLKKGQPEIRVPRLFVALVRRLGRLPFFLRSRITQRMVR